AVLINPVQCCFGPKATELLRGHNWILTGVYSITGQRVHAARAATVRPRGGAFCAHCALRHFASFEVDLPSGMLLRETAMAKAKKQVATRKKSSKGERGVILGPALQSLFLELDRFDSGNRTTFENDLHRELLHIAEILGAAQRTMTEEHLETI